MEGTGEATVTWMEGTGEATVTWMEGTGEETVTWMEGTSEETVTWMEGTSEETVTWMEGTSEETVTLIVGTLEETLSGDAAVGECGAGAEAEVKYKEGYEKSKSQNLFIPDVELQHSKNICAFISEFKYKSEKVFKVFWFSLHSTP
ncbi:protein PBMUCL2-like [Coregonus clupeaformis]|uniref:protein PBMUCL2-like n=1 Tax=Coregonus clupeaformis TaxID=59861 RepID=UPI001E1C4EDE|nr:protein PBMUCL2-like [Coregonus clupeaformis]